MTPKLSVIMTVHDRPSGVLDAVFSSFVHFPGNGCYDEMIVVNDRGDRGLIESSAKKFGLSPMIIDVAGPSGKRCPAAAWNVGFRAAMGTHLYCISSDTIQLPGSVETAKWIASKLPEIVTFGRAEHCGRKYSFLVKGIHTKTMLASYTGEPLGFVWIIPRVWLDRITPFGYDEAYMDGFCFEDNDLMMRLMLVGADFLICDDICGQHIEHDRKFLLDLDGKVSRNREIMESRGLLDKVISGGIQMYMVGPGVSIRCHTGETFEYVRDVFASGYSELI